MTSPQDPHSQMYSHINGGLEDLIDRFGVSELCKGWPVYRDASEWKNFRSLFAPKAVVWTTWSGPCGIDEFIQVSKAGKKNGVFIQHRECGTLAELGPAIDTAKEGGGRCVRRAIGKMKATITQRFVNPDDDVAFDVDCDCRFIFFCEKMAAAEGAEGAEGGDSGWRAAFVKLIYEKDRIVPADGHSAPRLTADERHYMREKLPEGYGYLGVMQRRLGYAIDEKLGTPRNAGWERMYTAMETWLAGGEPTLS